MANTQLQEDYISWKLDMVGYIYRNHILFL